MLKAIQAQEGKEAAKEKAEKVIANIHLRSAAQTLNEGIDSVRPAKNLLGASVSLVVFRNHEEIRRCGASGA